MKNLYKAELNKTEVFLVGKENNIISEVFQDLDSAKSYLEKGKGTILGIAVNNEVLSFGKTIGFIKNKIIIK